MLSLVAWLSFKLFYDHNLVVIVNITYYSQANTSEINEKMLYYKRELEKRETSYDKAFFPKGTTHGGDQGLRVSQRGNEESKNGRSNSRNSSTKGRGNSVTGTTKKLPKIIS